METLRRDTAINSDADKLKRLVRQAGYYERARAFATLVSLRGGALFSSQGCGENVIATGGGPGIMEAANRGATEAGAPSIGFNIALATEQQPNAYSTPELTFQFHYFAMRKMHLVMRANALAVFPGGFGGVGAIVIGARPFAFAILTFTFAFTGNCSVERGERLFRG